MEFTEKILENLADIYGKKIAEGLLQQVLQKLDGLNKISRSSRRYSFSEEDIVLITYADQFQVKGKKSLKGLEWFAKTYLTGKFNTIHILPFFPYSSDDGFSVIDYYQVAPDFGSWIDIRALSKHFRLMVDGVFNHISRRSRWFQAFLAGQEPYDGYFISVPPDTDLSAVVRPRTSSLLTNILTAGGERWVWTTFSDDQIDLNFANPQIFLEILDVLFFYIQQGARVIRIDAVPFLWKEIGTDCIHRPQTHALIKALRAILDAIDPGVVLITESNVPFKENISYLGKIDKDTGVSDEAQLVYQFSLGPLVLHALISGDSRKLSDWVSKLPSPYYYFNFIASHDGIGLLPAQGILEQADIELLVQRTRDHGGMLSYKTDTEGHQQVYELNITLYDFLNDPDSTQEKLDSARYLTSQIIMLELAGVPGVYIHSLFGSSNCLDCYKRTSRPRSINREKFDVTQLEETLSRNTRARTIMEQYLDLVALRSEHSAFSLAAGQRVLDVDRRIFALLRHNPDTGERVLCLSNLTGGAFSHEVNFDQLGLASSMGVLRDLISHHEYAVKDKYISIDLDGYQSLWLVL